MGYKRPKYSSDRKLRAKSPQPTNIEKMEDGSEKCSSNSGNIPNSPKLAGPSKKLFKKKVSKIAKHKLFMNKCYFNSRLTKFNKPNISQETPREETEFKVSQIFQNIPKLNEQSERYIEEVLKVGRIVRTNLNGKITQVQKFQFAEKFVELRKMFRKEGLEEKFNQMLEELKIGNKLKNEPNATNSIAKLEEPTVDKRLEIGDHLEKSKETEKVRELWEQLSELINKS